MSLQSGSPTSRTEVFLQVKLCGTRTRSARQCTNFCVERGLDLPDDVQTPVFSPGNRFWASDDWMYNNTYILQLSHLSNYHHHPVSLSLRDSPLLPTQFQLSIHRSPSRRITKAYDTKSISRKHSISRASTWKGSSRWKGEHFHSGQGTGPYCDGPLCWRWADCFYTR